MARKNRGLINGPRAEDFADGGWGGAVDYTEGGRHRADSQQLWTSRQSRAAGWGTKDFQGWLIPNWAEVFARSTGWQTAGTKPWHEVLSPPPTGLTFQFTDPEPEFSHHPFTSADRGKSLSLSGLSIFHINPSTTNVCGDIMLLLMQKIWQFIEVMWSIFLLIKFRGGLFFSRKSCFLIESCLSWICSKSSPILY